MIVSIATKSHIEEQRCSRLSNIFNYDLKWTEGLILIKSGTQLKDAIVVNLKTSQLLVYLRQTLKKA